MGSAAWWAAGRPSLTVAPPTSNETGGEAPEAATGEPPAEVTAVQERPAEAPVVPAAAAPEEGVFHAWRLHCPGVAFGGRGGLTPM